jgi:hypothetical protein
MEDNITCSGVQYHIWTSLEKGKYYGCWRNEFGQIGEASRPTTNATEALENGKIIARAHGAANYGRKRKKS